MSRQAQASAAPRSSRTYHGDWLGCCAEAAAAPSSSPAVDEDEGNRDLFLVGMWTSGIDQVSQERRTGRASEQQHRAARVGGSEAVFSLPRLLLFPIHQHCPSSSHSPQRRCSFATTSVHLQTRGEGTTHSERVGTRPLLAVACFAAAAAAGRSDAWPPTSEELSFAWLGGLTGCIHPSNDPIDRPQAGHHLDAARA